MKVSKWIFGVLMLIASCQTRVQAHEYVVITGKNVVADSEWNKVVKALVEKHQAKLVTYQKNVDEVMPALKKYRPRYVGIVEKPETLNRDYVIRLNQLSRQVDDDIYADFLWGIITGYDAKAAMKMVDNSTEPLVIKDAVATIMELHSGKWFDRFAWVDDHTQGLWGEKKSKNDTIVTYRLPSEPVKMRGYTPDGQVKEIVRDRVNPVDEMQTFYNIYEQYNPDLVVTAAHATERNLEMPFSLGNINAKN
ncbi:MAG: hypothetical protein K2L23_05250 [Odoribacter sp.]|nr:hypothetical protein [Odoribacter sp.]